MPFLKQAAQVGMIPSHFFLILLQLLQERDVLFLGLVVELSMIDFLLSETV